MPEIPVAVIREVLANSFAHASCFSLDNLKLDDDVLNIPLFMSDQADRLIGLALEKMEQ